MAAIGVLASLSVRHELHRPVGADGGKVDGEIPSAPAHALIEVTPRQQEHEQHQRALVISRMLVGDGLQKRHRESENDPKRDRHVHIDRADTESASRALEERHAGVSRRRQGDERRKPVEEVGSGGIALGARPKRDREQHHVHSAEGGDAKASQQPLFGKNFGALALPAVKGMGRVAERLKPFENDGRIECAIFPFDGDALRGKIDSRAAHAALSAKSLLDRR